MIYGGYTELGAYRNIGNLSQLSLNKWFSQILVYANPTATITLTRPKQTLTNPKLTLTLTCQQKTLRYNSDITVSYA